jgi:hypothetical protein
VSKPTIYTSPHLNVVAETVNSGRFARVGMYTVGTCSCAGFLLGPELVGNGFVRKFPKGCCLFSPTCSCRI